MAHKEKQPEVADILRKHLSDYRKKYPLWPGHRKIIADLLNCRTAKLGGHIDRCSHCGVLRITYHSCRNRHCPKCQHMPRERWLLKRKEEILSTHYFHVVFTLPHELNTVILNNKKAMLNILFRAVSKTVLSFGENNLGGKLGFIATLHTWDQRLNAHFHLHCLVPGGVLSKDGSSWISCNKKYLFNHQSMGLVFRAKFMEQMEKAIKKGAIGFAGGPYKKLKAKLYGKKWVVDVRDPATNPEHVLEYLARYTHRVAISNSRITALKDGYVTFKIKNRKKNRNEQITISAVEFIRRFLLHSLPSGFVRIRHYGFLANRIRSKNLVVIRKIMGLSEPNKRESVSLEDMVLQLTGVDLTVCPCCHKGKMRLFMEIPRAQARPPNISASLAA
jgi:hypothetical protein